jgi:hypothetical protein
MPNRSAKNTDCLDNQKTIKVEFHASPSRDSQESNFSHIMSQHMETLKVSLISLQNLSGNLRAKVLTGVQTGTEIIYTDMTEVALRPTGFAWPVELKKASEAGILEVRVYDKQLLKGDLVGSASVSLASAKGIVSMVIPSKTRADVIINLQIEHSTRPIIDRPLQVVVATWNVGNEEPPEDLDAWLQGPSTGADDLVVVGCQESTWLKDKDTFKMWIDLIHRNLSKRGEYTLVATSSLGQIHLVVFLKVLWLAGVRNIHTGTEATGIGKVYYNKGGAIVSLDILDVKLAFVTSHLAAHQGPKKCAERNANYRSIVKGSYKACRYSSDVDLSTGSEATAGGDGNGWGDLFNENHAVFWCGDLNYRLELGNVKEAPDVKEDVDDDDYDKVDLDSGDPVWKSTVDVIAGVYGPTATNGQGGDYQSLFQHDELRRQIAQGKAFYSFQEQDIKFAPTFKMIKGTEQGYSTKRLPAWCDRVLWNGTNIVRPLGYWSAPKIVSSDHRAVAARFELEAFSVPRQFDKTDVKLGIKALTSGTFIAPRSQTQVLSKGASAAQTSLVASRYALRLLSLSATGLPSKDVTGSSDPYVVFFGSTVSKSVKTMPISRNLNPVWDAKLLPPVILSIVPDSVNGQRVQAAQDVGLAALLKYDFVSIIVKDFDRGSKDDTCGRGKIVLRDVYDAMQKGERRSDFSIALEDDGLGGVGTLQGSWELVLL